MKFFVDFEASMENECIISIGAISEEGHEFSTLVKPSKEGEKIGEFVEKLTGISNKDLETAPTADEAFGAFFDWIIATNSNGAPNYYFYGKNDKSFLSNTVKYMTDNKAIIFIYSILASYTDYTAIVNKHYSISGIGLFKLYRGLSSDIETQRHDALEDATMLKCVVENLKNITIEVPETSKRKPVLYKKLEDNPDFVCSNFVNKKFCPPIFYEWPSDKLLADTHADENNWLIKCSFGDHTKYFDCIDTAVIWVIKYLSKGMSCKRKEDVETVAKKIHNAVVNNVKHYSVSWEYNKKED